MNQINTDLLHEFALTGDGRACEVPFDWYLGVLQVVDLCSLFSSIAAFSAFHRSKKKKTSFDEWRKTFSLETFFTRPHICNWSWYRIFSPPPAPVHRTTFLGQQNFIMKSVINRHPTWTLCFEKSNSTFSFEATNAKPYWERRRINIGQIYIQINLIINNNKKTTIDNDVWI